MIRSLARACVLPCLLLSACAVSGDATEPGPEIRVGRVQQAAASPPWKQAAKWPYAVSNPRIVVHYQATGDLAMAQTVLGYVENAWQVQVVQQGGRAPLDNGVIGGDARFDVWLQRGLNSLYVASTGTNAATPYDDAFTSMVLDPWGQYGGAELEANVFHEFRHGSQGADDWNEHIQFFEAEATLWETAYYGYPRLSYVWADYQAHPEWTPFKDDRYATWFMYGGALFLLYLKNHAFAGGLAWSNDVWLACRNPAGTNEPDFADALQAKLATRGTSLFAELTSFARARWYTGPNANGTLEAGDVIPAVASTTHARANNATRTTYLASAETLGTVYKVVQKAPSDGATIAVSLTSVGANAAPVVQLVGQGSGDRVLDFSAGPTRVPFVNGKAVLAVTMVPSSGTFDPDTVSGTLKATVVLDK